MPRQSIMVGEHQVGLAGVLHMLVLGTHPPVGVHRVQCTPLLNSSTCQVWYREEDGGGGGREVCPRRA